MRADYSDRIVAFIDCLGFRQKVIESANNQEFPGVSNE
jgi:hypothetical protein